MDKTRLFLCLATVLGLGFIGLMLPQTARTFRSFERVVSVRGLCEREVSADRVIWPVTFKIAADDLSQLNSEVDRQGETVRKFIAEGGVPSGDISRTETMISDKYSQEYGSNDRACRYIATCTVLVCSNAVDKVLDLISTSGELARKGVIITNDWDSKPQFSFEALNDIKPEMIEEATANARQAAGKFAEDSGSRLGKIKNAGQGVFSIEDRDSHTPHIKKIRVVTNVTYYLVN